MGITQSALDFLKGTESQCFPLFEYLRKQHELTPEGKKDASNNYNSYRVGYRFISYKDWSFEFGREFIYENHHGDEISAMNTPDEHYKKWEPEIIAYFLKIYAPLLPKNCPSLTTTDQLVQYIKTL